MNKKQKKVIEIHKAPGQPDKVMIKGQPAQPWQPGPVNPGDEVKPEKKPEAHYSKVGNKVIRHIQPTQPNVGQPLTPEELREIVRGERQRQRVSQRVPRITGHVGKLR
jgi:hypothetical protein